MGHYTIQLSQFNTRMPLHINDDDLCALTSQVDVRGHLVERPRSEFTMLSYTVHALEVAVVVRKSIDLRYPLCQAQREEKISEVNEMRDHLISQYEQFVTGLPHYFRLGSTVGLSSTGPMAAIPVQRWMLHQQLWSLFLKVHCASSPSASSRAACQLLAQNIISTQAQIQARCTVCGSLSTNETQLFNAAIIMLIDLLLLSKQKDGDYSSSRLNRVMARDKVQEAIELLRQGSFLEQSQPSSESAIVLEQLMQLEADCPSKSEANNSADSTEKHTGTQGWDPHVNTGKSLKDKAMHILGRFRENSRSKAAHTKATNSNAFSTPEVSMIEAPVLNGLQELDVLPMLSNDQDFDFWRSLDFAPLSPTTSGSLPTAEEMQTFSGAWPLTLSSGQTPNTSEFFDGLKSAEGMHVTM